MRAKQGTNYPVSLDRPPVKKPSPLPVSIEEAALKKLHKVVADIVGVYGEDSAEYQSALQGIIEWHNEFINVAIKEKINSLDKQDHNDLNEDNHEEVKSISNMNEHKAGKLSVYGQMFAELKAHNLKVIEEHYGERCEATEIRDLLSPVGDPDAGRCPVCLVYEKFDKYWKCLVG